MHPASPRQKALGSSYMRRRFLLLLLALLVLCSPQAAISEGEPLHDADTWVEDAILQKYTPPLHKQQGGQLKLEQEQQERQQAHEAAQDRAARDVAEPNIQGRQQQQQEQEAQTPDERRQALLQQRKEQALQAHRRRQQQEGVLTPDERRQKQQERQQQQGVGEVREPGQQGTRQAQGHPNRRRQQQGISEEEVVRRRQAAQDQLLKRREAERVAAAERANGGNADHAEHEAAHADLLETQRQHALAQKARLAAREEEQKQAAVLGRGSLRNRRQAQQKQRQAVVSGSRPGDIFAEQTEKRLAAVRQQAAERKQQHAELAAQLEAAHAAAVAAQARSVAARAKDASGGSGGSQPQAKAHAGAVGTKSAVGGTKGTRQHIPLLLIIIMTLSMAAAGGLGALPFFFVKSMSEGATGVATAIACGVMLAASFDLVHDGQPYGPSLTVFGVLLGGAFIRWVQQHLSAYEEIEFGSLQGSAARKTVLMVGIMAAHALGEGCAVGVSFCGERGWTQGVLTTLAIGVHNIPEGLAKATVLVGQGVTPRRALAWSVATCLPQPLVAIPSFMFVDAFTMILPVALGFAAGCMVWMVFAELLPDALERTAAAQVATAATVSAAGLEGFRMLFVAMEQADGGFGGPGSATAVISVVLRMGPPLLVLLPAVAAAAAAGGALGGSAVPAPVAWGVAAAAAAAAGSGELLDQLFWRPQVPSLHTAAAGATGAALTLLLHRHLLSWAGSTAAAAARKLLARSGASLSSGAAPSDLEALEYATLYQQHHLHHSVHAAHPLFHNGQAQPPQPYMQGVPAGAPGSSINGFGGSASSLAYQAPYQRSGALPGAADPTGMGSSAGLKRAGSTAGGSGGVTPNGGAVTPLRGLRTASLLPPRQLAAGGAALAALAASSLSTGWHLACSLLLLGEDRSAAILPAIVLLVVGPGLAAGALARTLPARRSSFPGAWLGGGLAAMAAVAAAITAARAHESAHTSAMVKSMLYPLGITDTAEAMAGGALCAAAVIVFQTGAAIKGPSARGGLLLGLAVAGLLAGLRYALCSSTPYCLSVQVLLRVR